MDPFWVILCSSTMIGFIVSCLLEMSYNRAQRVAGLTPRFKWYTVIKSAAFSGLIGTATGTMIKALL